MGIDLDPTAHALAGARLEGERRRAAEAGRDPFALHLLHGNYRWVAHSGSGGASICCAASTGERRAAEGGVGC